MPFRSNSHRLLGRPFLACLLGLLWSLSAPITGADDDAGTATRQIAQPSPPAPPTPGGGSEGTPNPIERPSEGPGGDQGPNPMAPIAQQPDFAEELSETDPVALAESLLRIALRKHENRQHEDARLSLYTLLDLHPGEVIEVEALQLLAASYRSTDEIPRAIAILERLLEDHKTSRVVPDALLTTGRLYRDLGAHKLAFARFYSVLNATLKLSAEDLDHYQLIARTAQFEIAETHLLTGRYEEAGEFFRRLSLLDLAPQDRARALFMSAYARFLGEDFTTAADLFERYLRDHNPQSPDTPEAVYLLSFCYQRTARPDASLRTALKLFDQELIRQSGDPLSWRYWQRHVGNHLANEFFDSGQLPQALRLYDQLAAITPEPEWRAPALYQVGLSAERLGNFARAQQAYGDVLRLVAEFPELSELGEMATWRQNHLNWTLDHQAQRLRVLGSAQPIEENPRLAKAESPTLTEPGS